MSHHLESDCLTVRFCDGVAHAFFFEPTTMGLSHQRIVRRGYMSSFQSSSSIIHDKIVDVYCMSIF